MPNVHIGAEVFVDRPLEQVRAFLADVDSPARWDRSVSKVIPESTAPMTVGSRFTTVGPSRRGREGVRSHYRIVSIEGDESRLALEDSPLFKAAIWTLRLSAKGHGTLVNCDVDATTSWPVSLLLALNRRAIANDLQFMKRAIEHGEIAKR
jgi:hypothetical protein